MTQHAAEQQSDKHGAEGHAQPRHRGAEKPAARQPKEPLAAGGGFAALGLSDTMHVALQAAEYLEPTPVQAGLIPRALAGADVMGQAQTGTGKTAAFAIPILEQLEPHRKGAGPQALVLVPTRELAVQVRDECAKLAHGRTAAVVAVYGGKPIRQQIEHLTRGAEMVVGTPGRVMDLMDRGSLRLDKLRVVVLDEADRMLDIGFRPDIEKILRRCPAERQTLLLSATIPPPVKRLAERYMRSPEMLDFSPTNLAVETIEQFYFTVDPQRKFDLLSRLLEREKPAQAIIFCRTKRGTEKVYQRLSRRYNTVGTIHGDLAQPARDRAMRDFRQRKINWLVATDVVGRGIDVTSISHIINYDIPQFCDDYVHRVGRTGRMGREGVAYTFVAPEEGNELTRIEMRINRLLKRDEIPGFQAFGGPPVSPHPSGAPAGLAGPVPAGDAGDAPPPPPETEKPAPRPVFGRPQRRFRRAL
ncbi:MAG: DEAD/DEAH box helicase [Thermoguttaceae bacterium]|jgi:ATP-dependent RNA helicase DeaD